MYKDIVAKTSSGNNGNYYLEINGDELGFGFYNGGWREHTTTTANLAVGTWYHVSATYSDSGNRVMIYLNGVNKLDEAETYSLTTNNYATKIGAGYVGEEFNGLIDEVKIYNRTLSAAEILADYNAGTGTSDTTPPNAITDLTTSNPTTTSITLTWTAPGDDNSIGTAASYDIRYSTSSITTSNWASATQATGEPILSHQGHPNHSL